MRLRVLAVTDLHQSKELHRQLASAVQEHRPTVVAVVGDLLHCGDEHEAMISINEAAAHLCELPVENLVIVRGNHEDSNWQEFVDCWPNFGRPFHALYGSYVCFGPLMIVGFPCELGWEDPWRHTLPRSGTALPCVSWLLGRKRLVANPRKWLEPLYQKRGLAAGTLWLMHEPPIDRTISTPAAGNRRWNQLVQRFRPQLTISGHCHEVPRPGTWSAAIGSSVCVNVGQSLRQLHYSVIDFDFDSWLGPALPNRITVEAYPWRQVITLEGANVDTAETFLHSLGGDHDPVLEATRGQVLLLEALRGITRKLIAEEGGSISESELVLHWNTTSEEVSELVKSRRILSSPEDSGCQFPLWQFAPDGSILPGVAEVLQTLRSSDCGKVMRYFLQPTSSLDGARPLDLLRQGKLALVVSDAKNRT